MCSVFREPCAYGYVVRSEVERHPNPSGRHLLRWLCALPADEYRHLVISEPCQTIFDDLRGAAAKAFVHCRPVLTALDGTSTSNESKVSPRRAAHLGWSDLKQFLRSQELELERPRMSSQEWYTKVMMSPRGQKQFAKLEGMTWTQHSCSAPGPVPRYTAATRLIARDYLEEITGCYQRRT